MLQHQAQHCAATSSIRVTRAPTLGLVIQTPANLWSRVHHVGRASRECNQIFWCGGAHGLQVNIDHATTRVAMNSSIASATSVSFVSPRPLAPVVVTAAARARHNSTSIYSDRDRSINARSSYHCLPAGVRTRQSPSERSTGCVPV